MPPGPDRGHGERRSVVVDPHLDPAVVAAQVVDAIRDGLAQHRVFEVVDLDPYRLALRVPILAGVLELADEFLLFVSTLMTGSPARRKARTLLLM